MVRIFFRHIKSDYKGWEGLVVIVNDKLGFRFPRAGRGIMASDRLES